MIVLKPSGFPRGFFAVCVLSTANCWIVHLVFEYSLYQPVQIENPGLWVTADQRKLTQLQDSLIELERINGYSFEKRAEFWRALHDDLFRDSIRVQKSTEPQEIGGSWISLLYLCKGQ